MKNISLVINAVLLVAVAVLYYLYFSSSSTASGSASTVKSSAPAGTQVVYVNFDTLLTHYKLVDDLKADLDQRKANAQKQFLSKGQALEKDVLSFQRKYQAGLLAASESEFQGKTLEERRNKLAEEGRNIEAGLMEIEAQMNQQFYDSVVTFLKDYNKDKQYKYVLDYRKGGGTVILGDESLEITNEVLKGLNERYEKAKEKKTENK